MRSVSWEGAEDAVAYLREKKNAGALIVALEITDGSRSIFDYSLPATVTEGQGELLLVAGTEAGGVTPGLLALCDVAVHLPMYGQNTSMNVAVALGAAVYLLLEKFSRAGEVATGP